jgi:hypothetical protein
MNSIYYLSMTPLLPIFTAKNPILYLPRTTLLKKTQALRNQNEIVLWNHPKTHQMIAYACIGWAPLKTSPFYQKSTPEITKLFSLRGFKNTDELSKLIDRVEKIMALRGHLTYGATVKITDKEKLSFFLSYGYEIKLVNESEETAYLLKKRELLT